MIFTAGRTNGVDQGFPAEINRVVVVDPFRDIAREIVEPEFVRTETAGGCRTAVGIAISLDTVGHHAGRGFIGEVTRPLRWRHVFPPWEPCRGRTCSIACDPGPLRLRRQAVTGVDRSFQLPAASNQFVGRIQVVLLAQPVAVTYRLLPADVDDGPIILAEQRPTQHARIVPGVEGFEGGIGDFFFTDIERPRQFN